MPSSILNSDDGVISGTAGLKNSGGDDAVLLIQTKGVTAATVSASQVFDFVNPPTGIPTATIATTAEAQAGTNNTAFITPLRLREGFNASGTAPVFATRAWVNFNGTGTVAIRASGNVSSITDNGVGDYTVNFATAMPDANYSALATCNQNAVGNATNFSIGYPDNSSAILYSTTQLRLLAKFSSASGIDITNGSVAIFR